MTRQIRKTIEVVEQELIPYEGEIDPENPPKPKYRTVSERRFIIQKYAALDGVKIVKVFAAKILPVFQSFVPLISNAAKEDTEEGVNANQILSNLAHYLSLDAIAATLDKVSPDDLDYIMKMSLRNVFEVLPAGDAQVMNPDGTFGVMDIEYDPMLMLRLVCETVLWGIGDFFDGGRWRSIMSPLSSSL